VTTIAEAANVLLTRGPGSHEVLVVRRALRLRSFGGFHAFPGGKAAPDDANLLPATCSLPSRRVAAVRELFEETGILLARRPDGSFPVSQAIDDALRREVCAGRLTFAELLARLGLVLQPDDLTELGAFVTPAFSPLRFDTTFFLAHLPPEQEFAVWPGELDEGRWVVPAGFLNEWNRGDCLIAPPALTILQALRGRPIDDAPKRLARHFAAHSSGMVPPIFYAPLVQMIPLQTMALPPSTHTNAYLIGGDPAYLLDPGPTDAAEQNRLFEALDVQIALGRRLAAVILSHHHPDHVGAATVTAERYRIPIWAHPKTLQLLGGKIAFDRPLHDGDRVDLGPAPAGRGSWHLETIHTPGHASGHLAFWEPHYRLLLVGDMVSTLSSVVIAPPDGDLAIYLQSLRSLQEFDARLLLPSHGGPSARPHSILEEAIAHRAQREQELTAALGLTPRTLGELSIELYRGLPDKLMRFAQWQLAAGLQKLEKEGRAQETPEGWRLR
jgi:glyoxylase-like metal-dependent hydrolase (beta-lactamase superfamily II)/8-oxo-dGTP pyrophosphatase MutT (NUDIX family)